MEGDDRTGAGTELIGNRDRTQYGSQGTGGADACRVAALPCRAIPFPPDTSEDHRTAATASPALADNTGSGARVGSCQRAGASAG